MLQPHQLERTRKTTVTGGQIMSKISKDGYEQIKVIKNALDSMFDKLEAKKVFNEVKDEFSAIAGIVELSRTWEEV